MKADTIFLAKEEQCSGCGACVAICPRQAISLGTDAAGFLQPRIDTQRCVGCAACQRVCPVHSPLELTGSGQKVFAVTNPSQQIRQASSSAGVFYLLAKAVLAQDGVVFGCAWETRSRACHIMVHREDELWRLQKSKYVQSHMRDSFREAKTFLEAGTQVLFSGTPCQIAGLRAYLGKDYDNLLLMDFVCHGVPNDRMLEAFLEERQRTLGAEVSQIDFRRRLSGLGSYFTELTLTGKGRQKTVLEPWMGTSYGYLFMRSYLSRSSCYSCPYATTARCSDITLGDYWGIRSAHPELDASDGVGLLIVSSEKGRRWLTAVEDALCLTESTMDSAAQGNAQLRKSAEKPADRDALVDAWSREGYDALHRSYRGKWRQTAVPRAKIKLKIALSGLLRKENRKGHL